MGKRSRDQDNVPGGEDDLQTATSDSPTKIVELEEDQPSLGLHKMQCSLPPHLPLSFASTQDFDVHYAKEHTNRCSSCGKNFPSAHYLALHLHENHDPLREVLAAQGEKTYSCFIEDCDKKCSTPQKRRLHLIDKHMFPKVYNFRIVDQGIDRTTSLLQGGQRRRLSTTSPISQPRKDVLQSSVSEADTSLELEKCKVTAQKHREPRSQNGTKDGNNTVAKTEIHDLETSFAALKFVPPSVQARQRSSKSER